MFYELISTVNSFWTKRIGILLVFTDQWLSSRKPPTLAAMASIKPLSSAWDKKVRVPCDIQHWLHHSYSVLSCILVAVFNDFQTKPSSCLKSPPVYDWWLSYNPMQPLWHLWTFTDNSCQGSSNSSSGSTSSSSSSSSRSGTDGSLVTIQHVTGVLRVKKRTAN